MNVQLASSIGTLVVLGVVVALVVVLLIALLVYVLVSRARTRRLRGRFGPEYDRTFNSTGSRAGTERDLQAREEHRSRLTIRDLEPEVRAAYAARWQDVQVEFVDAPREALQQADGLVVEIMSRSGYPMDNFDQLAGDVSVDHPQRVEDYRVAHETYLASTRNDATTELLRRAMQHYRSLCESLLSLPVSTTTATEGRPTAVTDDAERRPGT